MNVLKILVFLVFFYAANSNAWLTGPFIAPSGKTHPAGHINLGLTNYYTHYPQHFKNFEMLPNLTWGVMDKLDLQITLPFDFNWQGIKRGSGVGDTLLGVGIQLLEQRDTFWPNLRLLIQGSIPTGRYENLNPAYLGTDQTGLGAYQSLISLNFEKLDTLPNNHQLRSRLSLMSILAHDVKAHGVNAFSNGLPFPGKFHLGTSESADFALEYALTPKWVPVFEIFFIRSSRVVYEGPGSTILTQTRGCKKSQTSLAPALGYSINSKIGVSGGFMFSIAGPPEDKYKSVALTLVYALS